LTYFLLKLCFFFKKKAKDVSLKLCYIPRWLGLATSVRPIVVTSDRHYARSSLRPIIVTSYYRYSRSSLSPIIATPDHRYVRTLLTPIIGAPDHRYLESSFRSIVDTSDRHYARSSLRLVIVTSNRRYARSSFRPIVGRASRSSWANKWCTRKEAIPASLSLPPKVLCWLQCRRGAAAAAVCRRRAAFSPADPLLKLLIDVNSTWY